MKNYSISALLTAEDYSIIYGDRIGVGAAIGMVLQERRCPAEEAALIDRMPQLRSAEIVEIYKKYPC